MSYRHAPRCRGRRRGVRQRAGLRAVDFNTAALGDVIVAVDDKTVRRLSDLANELERNGVGKTVPLTCRGRTRTVETEVVGRTL
jgi:S1-C subfamily serine protease